MPEYTFDTLSPSDFELLVRDLLQKEFGERFESFSSGSDEGIDLRHAKSESRTTIVQCKHYANTPWRGLLKSLESEREKLGRLKPERYIVATSQRLNPGKKRKIIRAVSPYCNMPGDILGREELNALLSRHPEVEKAHYKLWMTSVPVLQKVLFSRVFAEQASQLARLRRRVSKYVVNPSFDRARAILSDTGFCMISGAPGIGKTTLAEMLVIDHIDQGFECFPLWESISEARVVLSTERLQLFLFDDFLGRTGLREPARRNEDTQLLSFIEDVLESQNTRLILTTREYILNQAIGFMEALAAADLDQARCVIQMEDFTPRIRAEILYNHLYYSSLSREYIEEVVKTGTYLQIIRHPNYSPRIIEAMTQSLQTKGMNAAEYPQAFVDNLQHPDRVWQIAYEAHIAESSRDLLLVMCSLPNWVAVASLRKAFWRFHKFRKEKYHVPGTAYDFKKALKELLGTFVKTTHYLSTEVAEFQNPSIRDFMEKWLAENLDDAADLAEACEFNEQVAKLWELASRWGFTTDSEFPSTLAGRYIDTFDSDEIRLIAYHGEGRGIGDMREARVSLLKRFNRAVNLLGRCKTPLAHQTIATLLPVVSEELEKPYISDIESICLLIEGILAGRVPGVDAESALFGKAVRVVFVEQSMGRDADEYAAAATLLEEFPNIVDKQTRAAFEAEFDSACWSDLDSSRSEGTPEDREAWYDEWEAAADTLGVFMPIERDEFVGEEEDDGQLSTGRHSRIGGFQDSGRTTDQELASLFDSLLDSG